MRLIKRSSRYLGPALALGMAAVVLGTVWTAGPGPAVAGIKADGPVAPDKAPCFVCIQKGENHGAEKVEATSTYEGKPYYFCSQACKELFDEDPLAYIPIDTPRPAPDFAVRTITGETAGLADYRGKWLLLDFWATWCKPCTKLMPEIEKVADHYDERGLAVLGVSIDENAEKAFAWADKKNFDYLIAVDDPRAPTWAAYRVKVVPTAFLINPEGQIVARWMGKWDENELKRKLDAVLPG